MITAKSNIEFLTQFNMWRRDNTGQVEMPSPTELGLHIEYAIESQKMQLKDDVWDEGICKICNKDMNKVTECAWSSCPKLLDEWDEERQDIIGQNGNVGYE